MFDALREELGLPPADRTDEFPADVLAEAEELASRPPSERPDRTDLAFVTIDPPGSRDLDQAVHLERSDDGFVVHYAIADLGGITPGGPIDVEARRRGQTVYLPDGRVPLHPAVLSEGALSLLPDEVRGAVVWTIHVGPDGGVGDVSLGRALVRSVARLDYAGVQADADAGRLHPSIEALPDLGRVRRAARVAAGALELGLPEQEIERSGDGWRLRWRERLPADDWNAEVSLLTGMAAARIMLDAGVGILRTLPEPDADDVAAFLRRAAALDLLAPGEGDRAGEGGGALALAARLLDRLDASRPPELALMRDATRLLRGAGYDAFGPGVGEVPAEPGHAGVGGPYAQVTAPLRRLADRFGTEVCVAAAEGRDVPEELRAALVELPDALSASDRTAATADRRAVDLVEAAELAPSVGRTFAALVVSVDGDDAEVMLEDPSVMAPADAAGLREGQHCRVELASVDVERGRVRFRLAGTE